MPRTTFPGTSSTLFRSGRRRFLRLRSVVFRIIWPR